jgi:hypothetical protein
LHIPVISNAARRHSIGQEAGDQETASLRSRLGKVWPLLGKARPRSGDFWELPEMGRGGKSFGYTTVEKRCWRIRPSIDRKAAQVGQSANRHLGL